MSHCTHNELIKFTKASYTIAKRALPLHSSRFSNHRYTQHQHIVLLSLMKRLRLTYREVVEVVALMPEMQDILGLEIIPHFTTLQKFFHRMSSVLFDVLLRRAAELFEGAGSGAWIAIDGTGHSSWYVSVYYAQRSAPQRQQRKRYTRNQIAVDSASQIIIAHRVARGATIRGKRCSFLDQEDESGPPRRVQHG